MLGKRPEPAILSGSAYANSFQATAGIPSVAAFGPGYLPRAPSPNEHLAAGGVYEACRIYALATLRYLNANWGRGKNESACKPDSVGTVSGPR